MPLWTMMKPWFAKVLMAWLLAAQGIFARLVTNRAKVPTASPTVAATAFNLSSICVNPPAKRELDPAAYSKLFGRAMPQMNYKMFTGYVQIAPFNYYFYWYFTPRDGNASAPLVLYSNGGPGCSSMEAATTENSPLLMQAISESCEKYPVGCDYTSQFSSNAYAWNAHSHLLFVDNPRGVGYSYGVGPPANGTSMAANDMVSFLLNFMPLYPELENNPLVISGESYFGHYGPAWGAAILKHNAAAKKGKTINLRGIMIGNGWIDPKLQNYESLASFAQRSNLVPADWTAPAHSSSSTDDNDDDGTSTKGLHSTMVSYIGYTFNEYDIRQRLMDCPGCMGYNYTAWTLFFQRSDVKSALGVCHLAEFPSFELEAQGCLPTMIAGVTFDAGDQDDYKAAIATALEAGVEVLLYYGQQDTVCNYVGGEAVAAAIPWSGRAAFNALSYSPLVVAGATVGSVKQLGRLGLVLVEGSGHMVPADEPATAAALLHAFLARVRAGAGAGAGTGTGTGTGTGAGGGAVTDDSTDDDGKGKDDKSRAKNKHSKRHSSSSSSREAPALLPGEIAAWVFASLAVLMVACAVLQRRQRLAALNNGVGRGRGRGRGEGEEQGVEESGGAIAVAVAVTSPLQIARRDGELEMGARVQTPFGSGSGVVDAIPRPRGPEGPEGPEEEAAPARRL